MSRRRATFRRRGPGQALVEFALIVPLFLVLLLGVFDLGRGVFMYNGVSQAAREIARTTSVHPRDPLGSSQESIRDGQRSSGRSSRAWSTRRRTAACAIDGSPITHALPCTTSDFVKVTVQAPFRPILFFGFGAVTMTSISSVQIP